MSKVLSRGRVSVIVLLTLSFAFSAACKKDANSGNANASNTGTANSATTGGGTAGGAEAGKPTAALRAYYEASLRKDIPAAKRYLSAGTMQMMEEGAKQMGKTVDEALEEGARQNILTTVPELSNEKISGDTATVDVTALGRPLTMQMVKEGGEWKIAMDKTLRSMGAPVGGPSQTAPEGGDDEK
ncbi:MAG TPA: nuclear transport factor 2 family protein [Pyrinomonadaceae bacterium]|nr:nuclear transport factor 2 family protein [Pyrinomonadaceae bacterium]